MSARLGVANSHSKYCDLVYRGGDCDCGYLPGYLPANAASAGVERMPCADVTVTIRAAVEKLCPVKNERDEGTVTINYRTHGRALELHDLAAYLATFASRPLSHEDFTAEVAHSLGVAATTSWTTAGMEVVCDAVLREPDIDASGA